jgi:hypothetical protein
MVVDALLGGIVLAFVPTRTHSLSGESDIARFVCYVAVMAAGFSTCRRINKHKRADRLEPV